MMVGKIKDNFFRSSKKCSCRARVYIGRSAEDAKPAEAEIRSRFQIRLQQFRVPCSGQSLSGVSGQRYAELKEKDFRAARCYGHAGAGMNASSQGQPCARLQKAQRTMGGHHVLKFSNYEYGDGGVESTGTPCQMGSGALVPETGSAGHARSGVTRAGYPTTAGHRDALLQIPERYGIWLVC